MTIKDAPLHQNLRVRAFSHGETTNLNDIESRLMHLGFVSGQSIKIVRKANFFEGPFLVEVRGRSIALNALEAALIHVEVDS